MPQLQLIVWSVSANRSTKQPFQAEHHVETAQGLQLVNHGFIEVHMRTAREHLCSMDALCRVAANARLTQVLCIIKQLFVYEPRIPSDYDVGMTL